MCVCFIDLSFKIKTKSWIPYSVYMNIYIYKFNGFKFSHSNSLIPRNLSAGSIGTGGIQFNRRILKLSFKNVSICSPILGNISSENRKKNQVYISAYYGFNEDIPILSSLAVITRCFYKFWKYL